MFKVGDKIRHKKLYRIGIVKSRNTQFMLVEIIKGIEGLDADHFTRISKYNDKFYGEVEFNRKRTYCVHSFDKWEYDRIRNSKLSRKLYNHKIIDNKWIKVLE